MNADQQHFTGVMYADDDSHPTLSLIDEALGSTSLERGEDAYQVTARGVEALLDEMLKRPQTPNKVDRIAVDELIAQIDARLTLQLNAILHHPQVQALEAQWRGLKSLVDRVDFRENIRIDVLSATKQEIFDDFEDAADITQSGLYQKVYASEYGVFGGQPYGAIVGSFAFGPNTRDMTLLRQCGQVAALSHAPLLTNASPSFFGGKDFASLPALKDLRALLEGPQYTKWHAFRDSEESRYVGLCLPRFLLRLPYGSESTPVKTFNFEEEVSDSHDSYLWGHASYLLASRVADSFAHYRWCPNIIGPQAGGTVDNLPLHTFESTGSLSNKIPTEILLTERREFELSEEGFIGLTFRKDSDNACFFSANSAQRPRSFGNSKEGKQAETNFRLGLQLPYMFIVTRLAHYIKVLQREQLGSFRERSDLEKELNRWLSQYVADMDDAAQSVRARRPLRRARVIVEDAEGQPGWYRCRIEVQPHVKYLGASFTLSLVGRLDKA